MTAWSTYELYIYIYHQSNHDTPLQCVWIVVNRLKQRFQNQCSPYPPSLHTSFQIYGSRVAHSLIIKYQKEKKTRLIIVGCVEKEVNYKTNDGWQN